MAGDRFLRCSPSEVVPKVVVPVGKRLCHEKSGVRLCERRYMLRDALTRKMIFRCSGGWETWPYGVWAYGTTKRKEGGFVMATIPCIFGSTKGSGRNVLTHSFYVIEDVFPEKVPILHHGRNQLVVLNSHQLCVECHHSRRNKL